MKLEKLLSIIAVVSFSLSGLTSAASKTYQVTGPILEMNDTMIAVQKGKDRWEITRDASAKVTGELKVGAKVTITYTMTATGVEVKADKAAAKTPEKAVAQPSAKAEMKKP